MHLALTNLAAQVTTGWTVDITDHFNLSECRDGAAVEVDGDRLTFRPRKPWASQGRKFPTMSLTWWDADRDIEVNGPEVRVYRTATGTTSRSYKGQRQLVKTYRFHPPTR